MPTDEQIGRIIGDYYMEVIPCNEAIRRMRRLFDRALFEGAPVRPELYEAMEDARRLLGCERSHRSLRDAILRLQDDLAKARGGQRDPEPERMSVRLDIAARIIAEWSTGESRSERSDWLRALEIADIGIAADKESRNG